MSSFLLGVYDMAFITENKLRGLIQEGKQTGISSQQIIQGLTQRGHTIQGLNQEGTTSQQFGQNVVESGKEFVGGIATAVAHPVQTAKGLGALVAGGAQKLVPGKQKYEQVFDQIVDLYKQRYGSLTDIKRTAFQDPVGVTADVATILSGVGGIAKGVATVGSKAGLISKVGEVASTAGRVAEPVTLASKGLSLLTKGVMEGRANRYYASSIKAAGKLAKKDVVATGLEEGITVGKSGLNRIEKTITSINDEISDLINSSVNKNKPIEVNAVLQRLDETRDFFGNTIIGKEFVDKIDDLANNFRKQQGKVITVSSAQKLKKNTNSVLNKAYGELSTVQNEAIKSIVRGLKEEIVSKVKEVGPLNKRESALISLEKALEKTVGREANKQIIGFIPGLFAIGGTAGGGVRGGVIAAIFAKVIDNPVIKSKVAILLHKAAKGGTTTASKTSGLNKLLFQSGRLQQRGLFNLVNPQPSSVEQSEPLPE